MNVTEAAEVFDGAMLSDAGLLRPWVNAYLQIAVSGKVHLDWLNRIKLALALLGVSMAPKYPEVRSRTYKGAPYDYCLLSTRVSEFLTKQYERWYVGGVKQVPPDLALTPAVLGNWFVGDGSSSRHKLEMNAVVVTLQTQAFNPEGIGLLEALLYSLEIDTGRMHDKRVKKGSGVIISVNQASVNHFMDIVEPFMVDSYMYKIKRRWKE